MPNTISSTWQFPSGSEYGNHAAQAAAAEQYTGMGTAPVAAELGVATTPIREAVDSVAEFPAEAPAPAAPEQYYTNTGDAIPTERSEAVLDAARNVFDVLDTPTVVAAQEILQDANHDQAAYERMKFYGPTLEAMRDGALHSKGGYDLAA